MSIPNGNGNGTGRVLVHHLVESRSERIFWVLEELGIPYDVKVYARTKEGAAPKALRLAVPIGKAPAITLNGRTYIESGDIIHQLLKQHASASTEPSASDSSVFWNHFSEGSLMLHLQSAFTSVKITDGIYAFKVLYLLLFFLLGVTVFNKVVQNLEQKNIQPMLQYTEEFLQKNENFSGSDKLGEGDFMMSFPLTAISKDASFGLRLGSSTKAWIERITARPAYKKAMARMAAEEEVQVSGPAPE